MVWLLNGESNIMRIKLRSSVVNNLANWINNIENSISQTIDAMKRYRNEVDSINAEHNNATKNASNSLASRINEEIRKKQKAVRVEKQACAFFNDIIAVDKSVAMLTIKS